MSNFQGHAINPKTGKVEIAEFLDDYYGKHLYGVRFSDGIVYDAELVTAVHTPNNMHQGTKGEEDDPS